MCQPTQCVLFWPCSPSGGAAYPSAQDLVDGCTFFQRALGYNLRSHFLHIQHERVKRFLYVGLLLFFFLFGVLMLSGWRQKRQTPPNEQSQGSASSAAEGPTPRRLNTLAVWKERRTPTLGLLHPGKWHKNRLGRGVEG